MTEEPAESELKKPRHWNGKDWWWCSSKTGGKCNGHYRVHKPSQCKGITQKKSADKKRDGSKDDVEAKKKLKISKALEALIDDEDLWEE